MGLFFIFLVIVVEAYYWFYWLPRHYREVPDCQNIIYYLETVTELRENK